MNLTVEQLRASNVKTHTQEHPEPDPGRSILSEIRMSRLSHPRANLFAMLLLAVVFLLFGLVASAFEPGYSPAPNTLEGSAMIFGHWLVGG